MKDSLRSRSAGLVLGLLFGLGCGPTRAVLLPKATVEQASKSKYASRGVSFSVTTTDDAALCEAAKVLLEEHGFRALYWTAGADCSGPEVQVANFAWGD